MRRLILGLAFFSMNWIAAGASHGGAILVSYTVSGSPGSYDLDFRVTNNMTAWHQNVYLFGVSLGGFDAAGDPSPFHSLGATTLNFASYGGSNVLYDTNWQADLTRMDLFPGDSLAGFVAHVADPVAPTSMSWFAFSQDEVGFDNEPYTGGESFNGAFTSTNPGFEGVARPSAVPEPCGLALLGSGLLVLLAKRLRGRRAVWLGAVLIPTIGILPSLDVKGNDDRTPPASARPPLPQTWDAERLEGLQVPLAHATASARHVSEGYYTSLPVRPIYKSYDVYRPDLEPKGHLERLRGLEPEVLWDAKTAPPLDTEADWIKAGELVFDASLGWRNGSIMGPYEGMQVRDPEWYEYTKAPSRQTVGCHSIGM